MSPTLPGGRDITGGRRTVTNLKNVLRAFGDGNLFGEPHGEGPVRVVWLHGWARTSRDFDAAARLLSAAGVASVALDLPGFGSSPAPSVAGGARHYADLVAPVLERLGGDPVVLVGHSFGGRVATVLAANRPELVATLVLTGVPLLREAPSRRSPRGYRLIRWLRTRGVISEQRMERARQRYGSFDYRHASGVVRDVLVATVNEGYENELSRLSVPVVMCWGRDDLEVPLRIAEHALTRVSGSSSLRILDNVGHLVPTSAPDALAEIVLETLQ